MAFTKYFVEFVHFSVYFGNYNDLLRFNFDKLYAFFVVNFFFNLK